MFEHPLWREKPLETAWRLAACLVRQRVTALHKVAVSYDAGRSRIEVDVTTQFGYGFYRYGHSDPDINLMRRWLAPGDIFIDGGAHIGLFALAAAAQVGPAGRVIAFEPASETRRHLIRNQELSAMPWLVVRSEALADQAGKRNFIAFGSDAWGSSSFAPPSQIEGAREETVTVTTLDAALADIDPRRIRLIKLDLEGAEYAALRGAEAIIQSARPDFLIEMEPDHLARQNACVTDIYALLEAYEYRFLRANAKGVLEFMDKTERENLQGGERPNILATTNPERALKAKQ